MTINPTRFIRLAVIGLVLLALSIGSVVFTLAWRQSWLLTHPGCARDLPQVAGLPAPQTVILSNKGGSELLAWYYLPHNGVVLIALGGPGGALGDNQPPVLYLVKEGYGALQIDSRACASPPSSVTLGGKEIEDVEAGLKFLEGQTEVRHIAIMGFSMGGVTAIRAAARHFEIAAVIAEGGFFNLGDDMVETGVPKPFFHDLILHFVAGAFWMQTGENPWAISPIDDLPKLSPRPVLLIFGEGEAASARAEMQFQAALPPKELWIIPGGEHGGNYELVKEEYQQRLLVFLEEALR